MNEKTKHLCIHGRTDYRNCPHCLGLNESVMTTDEKIIEEFVKNLKKLGRKTDYDGSYKEPTKFGYKSEINLVAIENYLKSSLQKVREEERKRIVEMLEEFKKDFQKECNKQAVNTNQPEYIATMGVCNGFINKINNK